MDWMTIKDKLSGWIGKYKYVALVLFLGIVLMNLPEKTSIENLTETAASEPAESESINELLEAILGQIKGAGEVKVMLTIASGEETLYQTDIQNSTNDNGTSNEYSTVIITDADRAQEGLVRQVNPAEYLGAIIVCEGADSPTVRLAIVDAVSKVTGLSTDRISVLKMK